MVKDYFGNEIRVGDFCEDLAYRGAKEHPRCQIQKISDSSLILEYWNGQVREISLKEQQKIPLAIIPRDRIMNQLGELKQEVSWLERNLAQTQP